MPLVWMHPPRDLTPQEVPEQEVTLLQAIGWLHADPPAIPLNPVISFHQQLVDPEGQVHQAQVAAEVDNWIHNQPIEPFVMCTPEECKCGYCERTDEQLGHSAAVGNKPRTGKSGKRGR